MTARTHDAIAFASLISIATFYPPSALNLMTLVGSIIAADIGSLLPDLDQASNRLWDLLPAGDTMGKIFRRLFWSHRTLSHSILGTYTFYIFLQWLLFKIINPAILNPQIILVSIMVGYLSHLLADSFTKEGLPLFFPFKITIGLPPIKTFRIKTGKFVENLIIFPSVWIYLIFFIYYNQDKLLVILRLIN